MLIFKCSTMEEVNEIGDYFMNKYNNEDFRCLWDDLGFKMVDVTFNNVKPPYFVMFDRNGLILKLIINEDYKYTGLNYKEMCKEYNKYSMTFKNYIREKKLKNINNKFKIRKNEIKKWFCKQFK